MLCRKIKIILGTAVLILLTGCIDLLLKRGFPEYSGAKYLAGLNEPVQIYRDEFGIPHIYAENEHDLFFCQGYVHAQDRLWQMETFRRLMRGRTAEVGGKELADLDMFMYILRSEETAKKLSLICNDKTRTVLDAYIQGVNAYIAVNKKNLPLEFDSLGLMPEPYSRRDAFSSVILISWFLNQNYSEELFAVQAMSKIPIPEIIRLFPAYPADLFPDEVNHLHTIRSLKIAPLIPAAHRQQQLGGQRETLCRRKTFTGERSSSCPYRSFILVFQSSECTGYPCRRSFHCRCSRRSDRSY